MTTEACLAHWSGTHSEIGARLPGVRAYVQNHGVLADGRFLLPYPGFDIMPELDWDDLDAMDAAIDSPAHEQDSIDDEANFLDVSRTGYAVTERHVHADGAVREGAVKLITLLRLAPNADRAALAASIIGPYSEAVSRTKPMRHEALLTFADRDGRPAFAVQAVDMIWFADEREALAWVGSDAQSAAAWQLAGVAFGTERLIARPHKIV